MRSLGLPLERDYSQMMMKAVKDIYGQNEALSKFSALIGQLRRRLSLTDWGGLLPPTLHDKDRLSRIFTIVEWAGCPLRHDSTLPFIVKHGP